MIDPAELIRDHLVTAGIGFTVGTNLFLGPTRAISALMPKNAAFVRGVPAGTPSARVMQEAEEIIRTITVIDLRWLSFGAGDTKMREIHDKIRGKIVTGLIDNIVDGEPLYLGADADGNHLFMLNVEAVFIQAQAA